MLARGLVLRIVSGRARRRRSRCHGRSAGVILVVGYYGWADPQNPDYHHSDRDLSFVLRCAKHFGWVFGLHRFSFERSHHCLCQYFAGFSCPRRGLLEVTGAAQNAFQRRRILSLAFFPTAPSFSWDWTNSFNVRRLSSAYRIYCRPLIN